VKGTGLATGDCADSVERTPAAVGESERVAVARLVAAIPESQVVQVIALRPARASHGRGSGPVDAVRVDVPVFENGYCLSAVELPHTRSLLCWVMLKVPSATSSTIACRRFHRSSRILVAFEALGLNDSAAVAELFRDLSRKVEFSEIVVFGQTVNVTDGVLTCWIAVGPDCLVPEALEEELTMSSVAPSNAADLVDNKLGVLGGWPWEQ
jgi:hypothetical protein